MSNFYKGVALVSMTTVVLGCGNVSHGVAKDGRSVGEIIWPASDDTTPMHKGGTFPNLANLRQMHEGLNKDQVADLIGYPHFSEGIWGVREWNYVFNFRKPGSDDVTVCQYKVLFNEDKVAHSFYWKPESCADFVKEPSASTPPAPAPTVEAQPRILSADALFAFDKAELSPTGRVSLDEMAAGLRERGDRLRSVRVVGYADRLGDDAYNRDLSQRRADAVKAYLVSQGVPGDRVITEGAGNSDPVKECHDTSRAPLIACLAPNRRVEVEVEVTGVD